MSAGYLQDEVPSYATKTEYVPGIGIQAIYNDEPKADRVPYSSGYATGEAAAFGSVHIMSSPPSSLASSPTGSESSPLQRPPPPVAADPYPSATTRHRRSKSETRPPHSRTDPNKAKLGRDRSDSQPLDRHLLAKVRDREERSLQKSTLLLIATNRLETESHRANTAERLAIEYATRLRDMTHERDMALVNVARLQAELGLCKDQFARAQKEIQRAQTIVDNVEKERVDALEEAARGRTKLREYEEVMKTDAAREQGRKTGFQQGLRRAEWEERLRIDRSPRVFDEDEEDYEKERRYLDYSEEPERRRTRRPSRAADVLSPSSPPRASRPNPPKPESVSVTQPPPFRVSPSPSRIPDPLPSPPHSIPPSIPITAPQPVAPPPPPIISEVPKAPVPVRSPLRLHVFNDSKERRSRSRTSARPTRDGVTPVPPPERAYPTPAPVQVLPVPAPPTIRPVSIRNMASSPSRHEIHVQPDGWIPISGSNSYIELPAPHALRDRVVDGSVRSGSTLLEQSSTQPRVRQHDFAYARPMPDVEVSRSRTPPNRRPRSDSATSRGSTHISQYDLVSPPRIKKVASRGNEVSSDGETLLGELGIGRTPRPIDLEQLSTTITPPQRLVQEWRAANPDVMVPDAETTRAGSSRLGVVGQSSPAKPSPSSHAGIFGKGSSPLSKFFSRNEYERQDSGPVPIHIVPPSQSPSEASEKTQISGYHLTPQYAPRLLPPVPGVRRPPQVEQLPPGFVPSPKRSMTQLTREAPSPGSDIGYFNAPKELLNSGKPVHTERARASSTAGIGFLRGGTSLAPPRSTPTRPSTVAPEGWRNGEGRSRVTSMGAAAPFAGGSSRGLF